MVNKLVGRHKEQEVLRKALASSQSEMISVIGRRRVGKTYLIKETYKEHIAFRLTGTQHAPLKEQLQNFSFALRLVSKTKKAVKIPDNWMDAFFMLIQYLEKVDTKGKKKVVFLDEIPWISTHKSGFLRALSFFWNSWAVNENIVVVICGSAASWMIQKVVNHTGGLHNRITRRLQLYPFNLLETEQYLQSRNINLNRYHLLQVYMAMGGIPHYLKEIEVGKSATQSIEAICFSDTGLLRDEFSNLYNALFDNSERHTAVIRALASKKKGLRRNELASISGLPNGGTLSKILEELKQSGFIDTYFPFGKKTKNKLYRLTDEYSLFYLQFIENNTYDRTDIWQHLSQTQSYKSWSGYAFEGICLKHIQQIKKAMSIAGIYSTSSSFVKKGTDIEKGTQIDLLIDRNDQTINLFEIKFYNERFALSKTYASELRNKMRIFRTTTKTKKQLFWTLLTTFGMEHNEHSLGLIDQILTMDDLFRE